ncbi:MAG TPA: exodeoxyribonuclease VII large subunit [Longimicrobiales bacterium]|nr:exodeoxyribonuclease VII large subunit [Longimicrobiales bacterium]
MSGDHPDLFSQAGASPDETRGPPEKAGSPPKRAGSQSDTTTSTEADEPVLTVSQVNRQVRQLLEKSWSDIHVAGEVGQWTRHRSGHCYFGIKDSDAQLSCVLFRDAARRLPMDPESGMEVRVTGRLTLYEPQGKYQLVARSVVPLGEDGFFRMAFEKLRRRLTEEGLIDTARRRPLPRMPRRVGVVTSTTGAALRDILQVLERRAPWTEVVVAGARVQGDGSALEIAEAVHRLGRIGDVDVIIVGRGGGSLEDLWAFNEEPVARAIAASPVPVISAVGHETDHTISDLVADFRAPTPSAAAESAVPAREAIEDYVARARRGLQTHLRRWVERRTVFIEHAPHRLARGIERRLQPARRRVDAAHQGMRYALQGAVDRRRQRLARSERLAPLLRTRVERLRARLHRGAGRLDALSPLGTLERGFSVATDTGGRVLRGIDDFAEDGEFELRVNDGRVSARVTGTERTPAAASGGGSETSGEGEDE